MKKRKTKSDNMATNNIKISQKMKHEGVQKKALYNIEK